MHMAALRLTAHPAHSLHHPPCAGLLRVVSWVLNGLDMVAQNAVVRTSEDGVANNTFWVTNRAGARVKKKKKNKILLLLIGYFPHSPAGHGFPSWQHSTALTPVPMPPAPSTPLPPTHASSLPFLPPAGHKLDDAAADLLAERVRDFVT